MGYPKNAGLPNCKISWAQKSKQNKNKKEKEGKTKTTWPLTNKDQLLTIYDQTFLNMMVNLAMDAFSLGPPKTIQEHPDATAGLLFESLWIPVVTFCILLQAVLYLYVWLYRLLVSVSDLLYYVSNQLLHHFQSLSAHPHFQYISNNFPNIC